MPARNYLRALHTADVGMHQSIPRFRQQIHLHVPVQRGLV